MQVFEVKTNKSDYPYLVIARGFKQATEVLYQKGIYDTDIVSIQQLESYTGNHILIEDVLTAKEQLEKEVRRELQAVMPRWQREPDGIAGGSGNDAYLIRTSKGNYFTSSCIGGNNHYLVLDTLENLPGLPEGNDKEDSGPSPAPNCIQEILLNVVREMLGYWLLCICDFGPFRRGDRYWLELLDSGSLYGRSDNLKEQRIEVTISQLMTCFEVTEDRV